MILDLVFNHTGERTACLTLLLRGLTTHLLPSRIRRSRHADQRHRHRQYAACDHPQVRHLVIETLRHSSPMPVSMASASDLALVGWPHSGAASDPQRNPCARCMKTRLADRVLIAEP